MTQSELPLSHTGDPQTSHDAEARHRASGRLGANQAIVLAYVCRWPGNGAKALHRRARRVFGAYSLPLQEIRRRLTDLDSRDLVERRQARDVQGRSVWRHGTYPVWQSRDREALYWPTAHGLLRVRPLGDSKSHSAATPAVHSQSQPPQPRDSTNAEGAGS